MSSNGSERNGWPTSSVIKALRQCAEDIGNSPSKTQYTQWRNGFEPSVSSITQCYGSWNKAKEAAHLETYEPGNYQNHKSNID